MLYEPKLTAGHGAIGLAVSVNQELKLFERKYNGALALLIIIEIKTELIDQEEIL